MNPDLVKRAIDLANTVRKTARGEHAGEEQARVEAISIELAAVRAAVEAEDDDPQRGAATLLLAAIDALHVSLSDSTRGPEMIARVVEATSRVRAAPTAPPVAAPPGPTLDEALDALRIRARRIPVLQRFQATVREMTRDKRFDIHNDILWNVMIDSREMLFVDLADWAAASHTRGGGGFLRLLQTHLGLLGARGPRIDGQSEDLAEHDARARVEARGRLFPGAGATTRQEDFEGLISAFIARFEPVMRDRNANRAHAYEHERRQGASTQMLNFEQAAEIVAYACSVIRDLTLLAGNYSYEGRSFLWDDVTEAVRETVEAVLVPRDVRPDMARAGVSVDALLEELHQDPRFRPEREIESHPGRLAFNNRRLIFRALERLGAVEPLRNDTPDDDDDADGDMIDDDA